MQDRVTTSFIPKESLEVQRTPRAPKGNPFVIVNIIGGFILVAAILGAGGLFLFKIYTQSAITSKQESLERQRAAFEPATIKELSRLDKRMNAAQKLLKTHTAPSLIFSEIESRSVTNVRFKDFAYEIGDGGKMLLTMSGVAKSFNSVALQADGFGKSTIIKDPLFSNLNIDQSGSVIFNFSSLIDASRITYAESITLGNGAQQQQQGTQSTTTESIQ